MPRSGSTLIEQILAAHSQVEGASELPDLMLALQFVNPERHGLQFSGRGWRRRRRTIRGADRRGISRVNGGDGAQKNRVIHRQVAGQLTDAGGSGDRDVAGHSHVVCRREPVETCWSCVKQFFAPGRMVWGSAFEDIAYFWERCTMHCDYLAARYPRNVRIQGTTRSCSTIRKARRASCSHSADSNSKRPACAFTKRRAPCARRARRRCGSRFR